jgi:diaminohydroxyphosphoribosylaminopyrimidine deaminase/5-amino-6-(5-phosphoribosylamino)uracil reductase
VTGLLTMLGARGFASVFCEGGATLAAALLRANAVDRLVWFSAGMIMGADARHALDAMKVERLAHAPRFRRVHMEAAGPDIMSLWERDTRHDQEP